MVLMWMQPNYAQHAAALRSERLIFRWQTTTILQPEDGAHFAGTRRIGPSRRCAVKGPFNYVVEKSEPAEKLCNIRNTDPEVIRISLSHSFCRNFHVKRRLLHWATEGFSLFTAYSQRLWNQVMNGGSPVMNCTERRVFPNCRFHSF